MQRRGLIITLGSLAVVGLAGGCGFSPLYGTADGQAGGVADKLRQIDVALIPERSGQLLRQALQQRLEGAGGAAVKGYVLAVNLSVSSQGLATEFATSAQTRMRVVGTAQWSLTSVQGEAHQITSGSAKTIDSFNTIDVQYFYNDLRNEEVLKQISQELSQRITTQIAEYFKNNSTSG